MALRIWLIIIDLILVVAAFCISIAFKPSNIEYYFNNYYYPFSIFIVGWIAISLLFSKYNTKGKDFAPVAQRILLSNVSSLALVTILM
ncbi:MAG: hypothetical protein CVT98_07455, partial [Bacteroidetes bacterium HGW-Bacteroidetes-15]